MSQGCLTVRGTQCNDVAWVVHPSISGQLDVAHVESFTSHNTTSPVECSATYTYAHSYTPTLIRRICPHRQSPEMWSNTRSPCMGKPCLQTFTLLHRIPRHVVEHTVTFYGQARTTQCPELLSQIITSVVVYIERVFVHKATHFGLPAVIEYWNRQIGGKNSNIAFRHLPYRMIRNAEHPIAMVHWLEESDNRREIRG